MRNPQRARALRRWRLGVVGIGVLLVLAACGDDASDSGADGTTTSTGGRSVTAFCDAYVDANNAASSGEGDPTPAFDAAEQAAPSDILDDVRDLIEAAAETEQGDAPSPEFFEANVAVGEYVEENCDFETIEVTALDYSFQGLPDEAEAGTVLVKFVNEGEEVHELAMFTINEGEERSLEELFALPEDQADQVATPVSGSAFALPGGTYYTTFDLVEGRTAAVCFIPVGATVEVLESGEEPEGAPHLTEGMLAELEVTA